LECTKATITEQYQPQKNNYKTETQLTDRINYIVYYKSPIGFLKLIEEDGYLTMASFMDEQKNEPITETRLLQQALQQLDDYFAGNLKQFDLPLRPVGTTFQQRVWAQLLQIPFGVTITYMHMAKRLQNTKAIRAAASANGKNPLAIIIPCHRVVGTNGKLTGYAGGLHRKQWLLEHEAKFGGNKTMF
jgi:methylated-DNA-[protein]-cysteine S-methyltransferase